MLQTFQLELEMSNADERFVLIRHNGAYVKLYISTIVYLKAKGSSTVFHVKENDKAAEIRIYSSGYNIGYYKHAFGNLFYRIHAAYHINLTYFDYLCFNHTVVLKDPNRTKLPVGRTFYSKLLKFIKTGPTI